MTAASPRTPGLAACLSMMMSRPASIRSGGFIAAAYTATNPSIADRNSAGPSSATVTFIAVSLRGARVSRAHSHGHRRFPEAGVPCGDGHGARLAGHRPQERAADPAGLPERERVAPDEDRGPGEGER